MTVTAYGKNADQAVEDAVAEINRLDAMLSTGISDSEIYRLNESGSGVLSLDASAIVSEALQLNEDTDGALNVAIYPVVQLWGFYSGDFRVPAQDEIDEKLALADAGAISFDRSSNTVSFEKESMAIDLGCIAKGYTSNRIMEIFREDGVDSGIVSLGCNVQTLGKKTTGTDWRVAIQDPEDPEGYLGTVNVSDKAVITSGSYERYFEENGVRYHHIIDPQTGYPADSGLESVTIVSSDGMLADGLSTSIFIMGVEDGTKYWEKHRDEFDMILYTSDGRLMATEGVEDCFESDRDILYLR